MANRRKTCECCKRRLEPDEDYWCAPCRNLVTAGYEGAKTEIGLWMADLPADASDEVKMARLLGFLGHKFGEKRA
jgi:hypothetical protein